jgi:hypothetical protein
VRVKCISSEKDGVKYRITSGSEYVVLGLSVSLEKTGVRFWIKDDPGNYFVKIPHELFELVNSHVSRYWVIKLGVAGLAISAEEFLSPTFLDDLTDFNSDSLSIFKKISNLIEREDSRFY